MYYTDVDIGHIERYLTHTHFGKASTSETSWHCQLSRTLYYIKPLHILKSMKVQGFELRCFEKVTIGGIQKLKVNGIETAQHSD